ncbi:hypothetical protein RUM44_003865 [Polyplax serrata]|uniref:Mitochondrial inner membrane protein Mpv17 n=1 Tax=Polyplax serrata TaxID=468196 RepID=A0ABR1B172_POLSC
MGTGDLIAQVFIEGKSFRQIDTVRMAKFGFVGTIFVGPPLRIWYGTMEKYFGSQGKFTALKKVTVDQLMFAPAFLVVIMTVVSAVQGNSVREINDKIALDYTDVLISNYKLWPAVQLLNFYMVPLNYQVLTVQIVAIFWNTYLSWKMNKTTECKL